MKFILWFSIFAFILMFIATNISMKASNNYRRSFCNNENNCGYLNFVFQCF